MRTGHWFGRLALVGALVLLASRLGEAQDAIAPDTVVAVKRATVLVDVPWGSGSGFVVAVEKDHVLIATNYHVIAPPDYVQGIRPTPAELAMALKERNISVVFNSGVKGELKLKAVAVAADADNDLAILRVTGLKDKIAPIDYRAESKLIETTTVYTFGFPLGDKLSTSKGNPAITVGKATVSSIRYNDKGDLAFVQIDGAINPGNSGGPVVDSKGRLVGVAVATIRGAQGIGLAVPAVDLVRLMKGRVCGLNALVSRPSPDKSAVQVEAEVADPTGAVREVTLHYLVIARGAKWPEGALEKQPGAKKATLKVQGVIASGEIAIDSADGVVLVQAVPQGGAGIEGATPVRDVDLRGALGPGFRPPGSVSPESGPPPEGWREHTPRDRTYKVWVPREWVKSQAERERSMTILGQAVKARALTFQVTDGPFCVVEHALLDESLMKEPPIRLETLIRDSIVRDLRGRVFAQGPIQAGNVSGKEYRIEAASGIVRFRVFVSGNWLFILHVIGDRPTVESPGAQTFLDSFRPAGGAAPSGIAGIPAERRTQIQGGLNDKEFIEHAPQGGLLIGMELALGKQEKGDTILFGARPIFRVWDREMSGNWHGPMEGKEITRLVAKPGYAVGAITVKTGQGMDGLSLTFMKVAANGRLDARDSYESPWTGGKGDGSPVKLGGEGIPVVGLLGRKKDTNISGMGLLYIDTSVPNPGGGSAAPSPDDVLPQPTRTPPQTKTGDSSSSSTKEGEQKKKGSSLTLVFILAGVIVLAAAFVGGYIYLQKNKAAAAHRKRRKGRHDDDDDEDDDDDDEDDDDDDDRPRRRTRRGSGRR